MSGSGQTGATMRGPFIALLACSLVAAALFAVSSRIKNEETAFWVRAPARVLVFTAFVLAAKVVGAL